MKNWDELKTGDNVRCVVDGSTLKCRIYNGVKYFVGRIDIWEVTEFDPRDWEIIRENEIVA